MSVNSPAPSSALSPASSTNPDLRKRRKRNSRQLWLRLHLWLGLSIGLLFALLGLTGSALVFYPQIDEFFNPQLSVETGCQHHSLDGIYQALREAHPERSSGWRLELPSAQQSVLTARYMAPAETADETFAPLLVSINPCTLEQTPRFWGQTLMTWIYQLHFELLQDLNGRLLLAIVGLLVMVSIIGGVYLWWPSRWSKWPQALRWRKSQHPMRNNLQLHNLAALYSLPVLTGLVLTGVILEQPDWFRPITANILPTTTGPDLSVLQSEKHTKNQAHTPISLEQVLQISQQSFPDGDVRWLYVPADTGGIVMVRIFNDDFLHGEASYRFANNKLWIDRSSGSVVAQRRIRDATAGDLFWQWLHPLHNGEAFGLIGKILVFISGLIPALLVWTGVRRWRQKQAPKPKLKPQC